MVCGLRWECEIAIPKLGVSMLEVPREKVKGRKRSRMLVRNTVVQSIVESVRGQHHEDMFPYRRDRIETMNQRRGNEHAGRQTLPICRSMTCAIP